MLKLDFTKILNLRGLKYAHTYLMNEVGFSTNMATKMLHGENTSIRLNDLEKFCRHFNCTPTDLFYYVPSRNDNLPPNHALHQLKRSDKVISTIQSRLEGMSIKELENLNEYLNNNSSE